MPDGEAVTKKRKRFLLTTATAVLISGVLVGTVKGLWMLWWAGYPWMVIWIVVFVAVWLNDLRGD